MRSIETHLEDFFLFHTENGTAFACLGVRDEFIAYQSVDWHAFRAFIAAHQGNFMSIMLSYDLKNSIESLSSSNNDALGFPELVVVIPQTVYQLTNNAWHLFHGQPSLEMEAFLTQRNCSKSVRTFLRTSNSLPKEDYVQQVESIKNHIALGDCYELNFCQEHVMEVPDGCDYFALYQRLYEATKAPFSTYFNWKNWVMLGASPERFF